MQILRWMDVEACVDTRHVFSRRVWYARVASHPLPHPKEGERVVLVVYSYSIPCSIRRDYSNYLIISQVRALWCGSVFISARTALQFITQRIAPFTVPYTRYSTGTRTRRRGRVFCTRTRAPDCDSCVLKPRTVHSMYEYEQLCSREWGAAYQAREQAWQAHWSAGRTMCGTRYIPPMLHPATQTARAVCRQVPLASIMSIGIGATTLLFLPAAVTTACPSHCPPGR